ncbi:MAG TPA: TAXI family TRAP transporter solute-binding subunit [Syntrophales bacterium]|nr:TAXI family TRAP transporter solute-binding subunit [Syntrophales bacterium]
MAGRHKFSLRNLQAAFAEIFGLGDKVSLVVFFSACLIIVTAVFLFIYSAPPHTISITSGPEGSFFATNAEKYRKILARNGVKLKILPSNGSLDNLTRLRNPSFSVDIGFVQGGLASGFGVDNLVSLGSISYEPLLVFYRGARPEEVLSQFTGKRLAIGSAGSGTHSLASALLAANGIVPGGSTLLSEIDTEEAAQALIDGKLDAIFLMGDSASPQLIHKLLQTPQIDLFDFNQAEAYVRRFPYLNKLDLPRGSIDFGKDIPHHDVYLIGPTVEIIARKGLHPALSDLLIEAAQDVHGKAGLFKQRGEFPAPLEHEYSISDDAVRYYKSGKGFLYRYLPFWMASLLSRVIIVFVPVVVLMIPVLRTIPAVYRWRMRMRIYRWYRVLLSLEKDLMAGIGPEKREQLLERLDAIEGEVNRMKVPAAFADQFYVLRGHIGFVHDRLVDNTHSHTPPV